MPIRLLHEFNRKTAAPVVKQESGTTTTTHNIDPLDQSGVDAIDTVDYNKKIKDIALKYIQWGLCSIPPKQGEKRPLGTWKEYQNRFPTEAEWEQWQDSTAIGLVCGSISGNLLVIDFDQGGKALEDFKNEIPDDLRRRLVIEQSQSGGYHIFVRSAQPVGGNEVLAFEWNAAVNKWKELIGTRGEGGFIVCAPSPGYILIQGDFSNIPVLQADEIDLLLETARRFDKKTTLEPKSQFTVSQSPATRPLQEGDTAFDWFVESGEWRSHLGDLEERGWRFTYERDGQLFFQTPEGDRGYVKHDGNIKDGVAYIFSRAPAPFTEHQGYSICRLFAGVLFGDTGKAGLAKFADRYLIGFSQGVVTSGGLDGKSKVTQSNTVCNTQSNSGVTPEILGSNGLFVTSVTSFSEKYNKPDTHRVMLLDRGEPMIEKTFRNQSNKSLSLRVVGGEKHYLTLYLQGDSQFEWHSKNSVTSVDGKVTNWLKSFKSGDSYTYIRDDNPANPNEWEIDLGYRTITHNTMSTPQFRTSTYEDEIEVTDKDCRWYWQQMKENRDGKYSGDWDYLENSLAYMVQGLYRKHGRPCTILMADDGGTAKKDLSVAIWNIISGVTRNSLDKLEVGKPGSIALFNSSVVIADESEDLSKADLGVLKNICDATFDTKRSLYANEETAEIRSLLIVMTNTLRIPLNRSYIRKFAYLGAGESKGGNNAEFNPEDEARFKRLSLSPRVHEYWYNRLMALEVDVYKAITKYGTEHLQEDNMDDLLEELRLIERGTSDFFCVGKEGGCSVRVKIGSTFSQIELKNYLLSRSDKTLLNGKKDIVKVLRGYIDRRQLNWTINERTSNLKDGTVKKQAMSITIRPFPSDKQKNRQVALPPPSNRPKVTNTPKYVPRSPMSYGHLNRQ